MQVKASRHILDRGRGVGHSSSLPPALLVFLVLLSSLEFLLCSYDCFFPRRVSSGGACLRRLLVVCSLAGQDHVNVHEIDAFWLQRQLAHFYKDAATAQKLSQDVYGILAATDDARALENKLVRHAVRAYERACMRASELACLRAHVHR